MKYGMKHPFAKALWRYMKDNGIPSYYGLHKKTGLNLKTAEQIFREDYGGPSFDTLKIIATGFGYKPGQFLNKIERLHRKIKNKK